MALIWTSFSVILKNITSKKTRSLFTIVGISLGVAIILAIQTNNKATLTQLNRIIDDASGRSDLVVTSKSAFFSEDILDKIRKDANIEYAAPLGLIDSSMLKHKTRINVSLMGVDPQIDRSIHSYRLGQGQFNFSKKNNVLITKTFAKSNHIRLGATISILTNKKPKIFKVVGILKNTGIARLNYGNLIILNLNEFQEAFNLTNKLNQIDIKLKDSNDNSNSKRKISKTIGNDFEVEAPETRGRNVEDLLAGFKAVLLSFSIVSLVAGSLLVFNTLAMSVVEKTRESALLRLIGFSKKQIFLMVLAEGMIIGLAAIIFGFAIGVVLSKAFALLWSKFLGAAVEVNYLPINGLLISGALGLGVTLIASLKPAIDASKISPLQAFVSTFDPIVKHKRLLGVGATLMLPVGLTLSFVDVNNNNSIVLSNIGLLLTIFSICCLIFISLDKVLAFLSLLLRNILPIVGKISIDNIKRDSSQTALTIITLLISIVMVVCITAISASAKNALENWIKATVSGDFTIRTNMPGPGTNLANNVGMEASLQNKIKKLKRVKAVTPVTFAASNTFGKPITFVSVDPKTYKQVISFQFIEGNEDSAFSQLQKGNAVFVSSVVSSKYDIKPGDNISLSTPGGKKKFNVVAIVADFAGMGQTVTGNIKDLKRYFNIQTVDIFAITVTSPQYVGSVKKILDREYSEKRGLVVQSNKDFKELLLSTLNKLFSLLNIVSLFAVVIAILGLVNTLIMSIIKQSYEISVLRALGFQKRQIKLITILQSQIITIISLIFGLLIGSVVAKKVVLLISTLTGFVLEYHLPFNNLMQATVAVILLVLIASIYPAYKATKLSIVESMYTT